MPQRGRALGKGWVGPTLGPTRRHTALPTAARPIRHHLHPSGLLSVLHHHQEGRRWRPASGQDAPAPRLSKMVTDTRLKNKRWLVTPFAHTSCSSIVTCPLFNSPPLFSLPLSSLLDSYDIKKITHKKSTTPRVWFFFSLLTWAVAQWLRLRLAARRGDPVLSCCSAICSINDLSLLGTVQNGIIRL